MQGELNKALAWAQEQALSIEDDLSYLREFDHITLAKVRLAQHQHDQTEGALDEAKSLLARLFEAAKAGNRLGRMIQIFAPSSHC